jgi:hypothetical protein
MQLQKLSALLLTVLIGSPAHAQTKLAFPQNVVFERDIEYANPALSHFGILAVDSLFRSCSGVNLSASHQGRPSGQFSPRR